MSYRYGSQLVPSAYHYGGGGLGVLGSTVPTIGPPYAYLLNDLSLPADAGKEVRGLVLTQPSAGTFFAYEDSSFTFTAPDGSYSFLYRLYVDGADLGTATATITVGAADTTIPVMTGALSDSGITSSGFTLIWPAATDNVAVTGYEVSINNGSSYTNVGNVLTVTETSLAASTAYLCKVRAYDAAGNRATPLSRTVTTASGASTVTGVTVSPASATGSTTFSAVVTGTGSPSQVVNWTATAGSITSGGVFTAPAATGSAQTITITATSVQNGSYFGTATVTIASNLPAVGRPVSDTTTGTWTSSLGGALYAAIDEVVPDASDYISASGLSTCELALNNTAYPGSAIQTVSYYAHSTTGNGITVALKQGGATLASWSHALTSTSALYTQTLTAGQIASIAGGALSVSLTST